MSRTPASIDKSGMRRADQALCAFSGTGPVRFAVMDVPELPPWVADLAGQVDQLAQQLRPLSPSSGPPSRT
jgi:hypothetical protein